MEPDQIQHPQVDNFGILLFAVRAQEEFVDDLGQWLTDIFNQGEHRMTLQAGKPPRDGQIAQLQPAHRQREKCTDIGWRRGRDFFCPLLEPVEFRLCAPRARQNSRFNSVGSQSAAITLSNRRKSADAREFEDRGRWQ